MNYSVNPYNNSSLFSYIVNARVKFLFGRNVPLGKWKLTNTFTKWGQYIYRSSNKLLRFWDLFSTISLLPKMKTHSKFPVWELLRTGHHPDGWWDGTIYLLLVPSVRCRPMLNMFRHNLWWMNGGWTILI